MRFTDKADAELAAAYLEQARESIVETVMLFGQYPQPRPLKGGPARHIDFLLEDFLFDTAGVNVIDPREVESFFLLAMIDESRIGVFEENRANYQKTVTAALEAHFTDTHHLVIELAEQYLEEEREEV